jgi:hypothetical protein
MTRRGVLDIATHLRAAAFLAVIAIVVPSFADVLQYGGGQPVGKRSFGGGGHLVYFDAGKDGRWLNRLEMYGSRYGMETPPDEDFQVYIVDAQKDIVRQVSLPYGLWNRGQDYWRDLPIPPIQVPRQFGIGLTFNATQSKGVYVGTTQPDPPGHSFSWTPGSPGQPMNDLEWLVRATVDDEPKGDPKARDLVVTKKGEAFFDTFVMALGDPLIVKLAAGGMVPGANILSLRLGAITAPTEAPATIVLANGMKLPCVILSVDKGNVKVRDAAGNERQFALADLTRIDFH